MAAEPKYEVGTLVKLKSGGPDMTVKSAHRHHSTNEFQGIYRCQWFAGKKAEAADFPEASLELLTKSA